VQGFIRGGPRFYGQHTMYVTNAGAGEIEVGRAVWKLVT
jgi:hypothetical protein